MLRVPLVKQTMAYFASLLHGTSRTPEARLHYILARSLRVCLGVPRPTSGGLAFAEAKEQATICRTAIGRNTAAFLQSNYSAY